MKPVKISIDRTQIRALFIAAHGYPMPGETFEFDGRTCTVHTVAHARHGRQQAVIAVADWPA